MGVKEEDLEDELLNRRAADGGKAEHCFLSSGYSFTPILRV